MGAGKEFSHYFQQATYPAQVSPKDSLLPYGLQHSALRRPQDAGFPPQAWIFASTTALKVHKSCSNTAFSMLAITAEPTDMLCDQD